MADSLWDRLCKEHGIGQDGQQLENNKNEDIGNPNVMFHHEQFGNRYVPRAVLADNEDMPMA